MWCALLFIWFAGWAVAFYPGNTFWKNAVYGVGGIGGFLLCAWLGGRVGSSLVRK